jgi:hypothetical protein
MPPALDRIGPALDEFGKTAPGLATLLRSVMDELADPRIHGFGISEDGITRLYKASRTFANLEDSANCSRVPPTPSGTWKTAPARSPALPASSGRLPTALARSPTPLTPS